MSLRVVATKLQHGERDGRRVGRTSSKSVSADADLTEADEEACIYTELLRLRGIPTQNEFCCTVDERNIVHDYFLLEYIRSGHYNSCCPSLTAPKDAPVELAPIRTELPFDEARCLIPVRLKEPLPHSRHIRLIALYHKSPSKDGIEVSDVSEKPCLHCDVFQASLDDISTNGQPFFMALSYVCGDQMNLRQIGWGSGSVGIPQNAYDALRHLCLGTRPRLVWLDYLCINQTDDREKSHQVRLLNRIYAQAHVVSWLGTGAGVDLQCVSFYFPVLAHFWTMALRSNPRLGGRDLWPLAIKRLEEYLVGQASIDHPRWSFDMLVSIVDTGYFERIWTAQEIILGKTNVIQVGHALFSVAVFASALHMLSILHSNPLTILEHESKLPNTIQLLGIRRNYLEPALHKHYVASSDWSPRDLEIVTTFQKRFCSDPRDHIYGLTSLFDKSDAYIIDYTLSVPEVFADFTFHCLVTGEGMSMLNRYRWPMKIKIDSERSDNDTALGLDLTSWCPNWMLDGIPRFDKTMSKQCAWRASGHSTLVCVRPSRLILKLTGFTVSTIRACSSSTFDWRVCWEEPDNALVWLEESLCSYLKSAGLRVDHNSKELILAMMHRVLIPKMIRQEYYSNSTCIDATAIRCHPSARYYKPGELKFSREMYALLEPLTPEDHFRSLFVPFFLATVDPWLFRTAGFEIDARIPPEDLAKITYMVNQWLCHHSYDTGLFFTEDGMMGTGYPGIQEGDLVCIFYGSDVPQILRKVEANEDDDSNDIEESERYILVGACNVDGLMYGEGMDMGLPEQDFFLI